jgi:enoyl-CoA hydratase
MDAENILCEKKDKVYHVTLNRPDKLNALNRALMQELVEAVAEAERDDDVSVMVIKGAGRAFSAGYDLEPSAKQYTKALGDPALDRRLLLEYQRTWWRLWDCAKPIIAQLHGYCLAGGTELAMMCDLVVAAEDARIGYPPLRDMGSPVTPIWPWLIGARWAKLLYFTGDTIDGRQAEDIGMINFAVPADKLDEAVALLTERLVNVPVDLLILHKAQVNRAFEVMGIRAAISSGPEFDALGHSSEGARKEFFIPAFEKGIKWVFEKRAKRFPGNLFDRMAALKK